MALGSFERTLVFDDSPLDRYMDGDATALDGAQERGLALFLGRAGCAGCHNGPNLTDNQFHALGVPDAVVPGRPGGDGVGALRRQADGAAGLGGGEETTPVVSW